MLLLWAELEAHSFPRAGPLRSGSSPSVEFPLTSGSRVLPVPSLEFSQTTGVLLDGPSILPLSLRRKFALVSCASLHAGEGCLSHIINGQRNLSLIYFTHRNESLFFQEKKM